MLIDSLLMPASTTQLTGPGWSLLLRQAREHGLLARLEAVLRDANLFDAAPPKARSHLLASAIAARSSQTASRFEIHCVLKALRGLDVPLVLMKGTAYVHADLPPARGRFIGDVDIMVPRDRLTEVELALQDHGWVAADLDEYDRQYYRNWSHEIPPLQHPERDTPLDVHHTVLPPTARAHVDAAALFRDAERLGDPRLHVLGPADMVLHSSVHVFNDVVGLPLRDLFDLHDLVIHFGRLPGFWDRLLARAHLHGLERPTHYLLRRLHAQLRTPLGAGVLEATAAWGPPPPLGWAMATLFEQHFQPKPPGGGSSIGREFAEFALYVRTHWLRMPAPMLARHLSIKAVRRAREAFVGGGG